MQFVFFAPENNEKFHGTEVLLIKPNIVLL